MPARAQGVAYVDIATRGFLYAGIERNAAGTFTGLTQTDANRFGDPRSGGGTFMKFSSTAGNHLLAQRAVQSVRRLRDLGNFVAYCTEHDSLANGMFLFCRFG